MLNIRRIAIEVLITVVMMYAGGQFSIELPGLNLPITLQSMLAILLPLIFSRRNAAGGILLYLIFAALGAPILATGVGGFEYFISDSGGYLIGFYLMALTTALLKPHIKNPRILVVFGIFTVQHVFLSVIGLSWIYFSGSSEIFFDTHISPYLPGIIVKSFFGALIYEGYDRAKALLKTYRVI